MAIPGQATERVSIELVLAVDVSLSINDIEFALEMRGIANAFRDPEVIGLIRQNRAGVAVTMTHWSGTYEAIQPLPWTIVTDEASARAYALAVERMSRGQFGNYTGLGLAIAYADYLIQSNNFEGDQKTIDVSGDGRNNTGPEPSRTRLDAIAHGVTINGLAILNNQPDLAGYYAANVIGGSAAFVVAADDFEAFEEAFKRKLKRELSPKIAGEPQRLFARRRWP